MTAKLGGIVLAGGKSSRMGSPKPWLDFDGEPLLARIVRVVRGAAEPVVVVAAAGQDLPSLPADVKVLRDRTPDRGPLEGLRVGLEALEGQTDAAFVASTDVPFLRVELVKRLADRLEAGLEGVVPHVDDHDQPLVAVYAPSVHRVVERMLAEGELRVRSLLERIRVRRLDANALLEDAALASADPGLESLRNVNTRAEYDALWKTWRES